MKKRKNYLIIFCCIAAIMVGVVLCGAGTSMDAAVLNGTSAGQVASVDSEDSESQTSEQSEAGDEESEDEGELVIIEVQDTETPAANIQAAQEGTNYFGLVVGLSVAVVVLAVALIFLQVKYGRLRQQTRRLEEEIAQMYAKNM